MNESHALRGQLDNKDFDLGDSANSAGGPAARLRMEYKAFLTQALTLKPTIEPDRIKPDFGLLMLAQQGEAVCSARMR
jgi:hypothetical protein